MAVIDMPTAGVYSEVPNKRPPFINFSNFSNPSDFIRILLSLILRKLTFFTKPSFTFLSLLLLFTSSNFHGKIACFCIYFSSILSDNLFLFLPSLYNYSKPFHKFQPPFILTPPFIWHFRVKQCALYLLTEVRAPRYDNGQ